MTGKDAILEKMRVLLVEDDLISRDLITRYITETEELTLGGVAGDGGEALRLLQSESYDLILMDIDLPILSGMEVVEKLPSVPYLIFITSSITHTMEAFEKGAVDYLHKPISRERFRKAIHRAYNYFQGPRKEKEKGKEKGKTGLLIQEEGNHYLIPYREIIYLTAHDKRTVVHTLSRDYETNRLLGDVEQMLPARQFIRIHRQHIINLQFVSHTSYLIGGRYQVVLKDPDETELTVSRRNVPEFKKAMGMD